MFQDDETDALSDAAANLNEAMKRYHQFVAASPLDEPTQPGVEASVTRQIQLEKIKREKQIEEGEAFKTG